MDNKISKGLLIGSLLIASCLSVGGVVINSMINVNNDNHTKEDINIQSDNIMLPVVRYSNQTDVITSWYATISEDILLNFRVNLPSEGVVRIITISLEGVEDSSYTQQVSADGLVTYKKITPQFMGRKINISVTDDGVEVYNNANDNHSLKQYVLSAMNGVSETSYEAYALKSLGVDLLRYGAAAQTYVGDNGTLVTDGLLANDVLGYDVIGNAEDKLVKGDIWKAARLIFSSKMGVSFAFAASEEIAQENLSVEFALNGNTTIVNKLTLIEDESLQVEGHKIYEVRFTGISALYFNDSIVAQVKNNGENYGETITYSVNSYIARNTESSISDLAKAAYCYSNSAVRYSESKTSDVNAKSISINGVNYLGAGNAYSGVVYHKELNAFVITLNGDYSQDESLSTLSIATNENVIINVVGDSKLAKINFDGSAISVAKVTGLGKLDVLNLINSLSVSEFVIDSNIVISTNDVNLNRALQSNNVTVTNRGELNIIGSFENDINGFAIECATLDSKGKINIDGKFYSAIHLNNVSNIAGELNIQNARTAIVCGNSTDLTLSGNVDIKTTNTSISVGLGTMTILDGNIYIENTSNQASIFFGTGLIIGSETTSPNVTFKTNGGGGLSNQNAGYQISGNWEWSMPTTYMNYKFLSGVTTIESTVGENVGISANNVGSEGVNNIEVSENATLNINKFARAISAWDGANSKLINNGITNLNVASQHSIVDFNIDVLAGKLYVESASVGIQNSNILVDGGFLHLRTEGWGVYANADHFTYNFNTGKALFHKLGESGFTAFCIRNYDNFTVGSEFTMGISVYSRCFFNEVASWNVATLTNRLQTNIYYWNVAERNGYVNGGDEAKIIEAESEEAFFALFN